MVPVDPIVDSCTLGCLLLALVVSEILAILTGEASKNFRVLVEAKCKEVGSRLSCCRKWVKTLHIDSIPCPKKITDWKGWSCRPRA